VKIQINPNNSNPKQREKPVGRSIKTEETNTERNNQTEETQ